MERMIPEWAPNLHPLMVHFPIALLISAVGLNLLALVLRRVDWLKNATASLFILGAISAGVTYLTGRQAADSIDLPTDAYSVLSEHADLALLTLILYGVVAAINAFFLWKSFDVKPWFLYGTFLAAAGGLYFLVETGEHGGELVFRHGAGISGVRTVDDPGRAAANMGSNGSLVLSEDGSWIWDPGADASKLVDQYFRWMQGRPADLKILSPSEGESDLVFEPASSPVILVVGPTVADVEVSVTVRLDGSNGEFGIVHHVQDSLNYDFVSLTVSAMRLGRMIDGKERILNEKPIEARDWVELRAVAAGRHFRGYIDGELITHGHGRPLPAGLVGIRAMGGVTVQLRKLWARPLTEES